MEEEEYEYQVCGITPETEEEEAWHWVAQPLHETLESAQVWADARRAQRPDDEIWVERRPKKWERVL